LEHIFAGWTAPELFGPPLDQVEPSRIEAAVATLTGWWAAGWLWEQQYRADLICVSADSRGLTGRGSCPGFEAPPIEVRMDYERGQLVGRWRSREAFGALHLAALPGGVVLEGCQTRFAGPGAVAGRCRWVRIDAAGAAHLHSGDVRLPEPDLLYHRLVRHGADEPPLTVRVARSGVTLDDLGFGSAMTA
jgi:hypothetical protein